jgi:transcriptional regulator with XRE-family HTH domain
VDLTQPEIIQILRRRADLNQGTLGAKAFNTSFESGRTKIKNIELGKQIPTEDDLKNMARVLNVAPDDLRVRSAPAAPDTGRSRPPDAMLIHPKTLKHFPGLEPYIDMLNKAVMLEDMELIGYIAEKLSGIFASPAAEADITHRNTQTGRTGSERSV